MSSNCKVTNKLATALILNNAEGDTIQLPPSRDAHNVPRSYIHFQAPSIAVADIEGYDYSIGRFADDAKAEPVVVEAQDEVLEPAAPPATTQPVSNGNSGGQRPNSNNPRNP
jgi:hypothetical protein